MSDPTSDSASDPMGAGVGGAVRWSTACGSWAVAVVLMVVLPLLSGNDPELSNVPDLGSGSWWLGIAVVTLQAAMLVRQPATHQLLLVCVALGAPVGALIGLQALIGATTVAVIVAAFQATLHQPLLRLWSALAGSATFVALGQFLSQVPDRPLGQLGGSEVFGEVAVGTVGGSLVQGVGTVGATVLVAVMVRSRREASASRVREVLALRREQAALVEVVIARERTAMARELHDIAAHHLSGIAVMTGAIGSQIDTDPEGAKLAVKEVRAQSRDMLRDLRRLVALLREDTPSTGSTTGITGVRAGGASLIGEESLAGVPGLVESAKRAGADATLTLLDRSGNSHPVVDRSERSGARIAGTGISGTRSAAGGVGPLAQLSAYRTVQEALVNAARHAPGASVAVEIDGSRSDRVLVSVRNGAAHHDPEGPGTGYGLVGMRERAELTGSDLIVGPTPDGGWLVELTLRTDHSNGQPADHSTEWEA